ncbi:YdcH family protein [Undibacterium sp. SXout11W]|uniref:YdcH family protein n=1 Tax=Undibacterium TaxID=401469 RepID=UPI003BEF7143
MSHPEQVRQRIIELEVEHRDLDVVINALTKEPDHDELQLRRLKKRKLQLKDHITLLKIQLTPDVPA